MALAGPGHRSAAAWRRTVDPRGAEASGRARCMTGLDSATVLHVLDHSLPIQSGYSYRSWSIVQFQRRFGLRPVVLTSPKQGGRADGVETIEGVPHYRTRARRAAPFVREMAQMAKVAGRIVSVARS